MSKLQPSIIYQPRKPVNNLSLDNIFLFKMSGYEIIRIDNLTVRKMELQVGENIIGNDFDTDVSK